MKIFPEIVLLASMGFLNFERADGMDSGFPPNQIIISMKDRCGSRGNINSVPATQNLPEWIKHNQVNQAPPDDFEFYIPFQHHKHRGTFNPSTNLFPDSHDPPNHTPLNVQIHIGFEQPEVRSEYYRARYFKPYNADPQHHRRWYPGGWFPANDSIYVTVPGGQKYRAPLELLDINVNDKKFYHALPGIADKKPNPKRHRYYEYNIEGYEKF